MEGAARRAEVRSVSKVFGSGTLQTAVLEGVSLSVEAGEVLMLVGPSGSGKTTLLSIIGCVLNATSGQVWVAGHDVGRRTPDRLADLRRRRIGFVFQQHNLLACLSAVENVEVPLLLEGLGGAERRRRAQEALERVRMGDRLHAKPRQLSGGQQQRVAIARACVLQPELLLCDEPTASLDWHSGQLVIDLLRELAHAQRRAVIVVTHDARLFPYADRMIEMEDGRIVRQSGAAP